MNKLSYYYRTKGLKPSYYSLHKDEVLKKSRLYLRNNREKLRAYQRNYYHNVTRVRRIQNEDPCAKKKREFERFKNNLNYRLKIINLKSPKLLTDTINDIKAHLLDVANKNVIESVKPIEIQETKKVIKEPKPTFKIYLY